MATVPARSLLEQAQQALDAGATNEAISLGMRLLDQAPQMVAGYQLLGDAFLQAKQPARALAVFKHELQLQPASSDAHYGCGLAYIALEQRDAAMKSFQQSLDSCPDRLDAQSQLQQLQGPALPLKPVPQELTPTTKHDVSAQLFNNLLPVSLADLALDSDEPESMPQFPVPATLDSLPEAIAPDGGFTWEPPTWLTEHIAVLPVQDEQSIFAKLVQDRPSSADDAHIEATQEYFSLDDIDMLEATGEPASLLTIDKIVAAHREYYSANDVGPAIEPAATSPEMADEAVLSIPIEELQIEPFSLLDLGLTKEELAQIPAMPVIPERNYLELHPQVEAIPELIVVATAAPIAEQARPESSQLVITAPVPTAPTKVEIEDRVLPAPEQAGKIVLPSEGDVLPPVARLKPIEGKPNQSLTQFEQRLQNKAMIGLVVTDLEAWIMTQTETAVRRRGYRLLAAAYMKQNRYGAAFKAYWARMFCN